MRRLQRMDVKVYRLKQPLAVPDFKAYGRPPGPARLPAGTYWVPMAQAQKHWVQAMLNEDTYTPFPYFYDVTGWSNPLLFNLRGGSSGAVLDPAAARVAPLADPARPRPPASRPRWPCPARRGRSAIESSGWLRYLLERVWRLPYRELDAGRHAAGGLDGAECCWSPTARTPTRPRPWPGRPAGPGRLGGRRRPLRRLAGRHPPGRRLGITTATLAEPTSDIPGSLLRVRVDRDSPLGDDVGPFAWAFYAYDLVMRASDPAQVAVAYPPAGHRLRLRVRRRREELGDTAAVIDEPVGDGRAVLFSFEPNFRAFTDGTQRLLRNAVLGPAPAAPPRRPGPGPAGGGGPGRGRPAVRLDRPLRVTVAASAPPPPSGCCAATAPASRPAGPPARSTSRSPTRRPGHRRAPVRRRPGPAPARRQPAGAGVQHAASSGERPGAPAGSMSAMDTPDPRALVDEFAGGYRFELDEFQRRACLALAAGQGALVATRQGGQDGGGGVRRLAGPALGRQGVPTCTAQGPLQPSSATSWPATARPRSACSPGTTRSAARPRWW